MSQSSPTMGSHLGSSQGQADAPPLREFVRRRGQTKRTQQSSRQNVGQSERIVSGIAGGILAALGLGRRDLVGVAIAGVGGALAYRGATGHCAMYERLGVDRSDGPGASRQQDRGVDVAVSFLINKSPEHLYSFWRKFDNLPQFMTHLKSVEVLDNHRSRWVAKAPAVYGGEVSWVAEITDDQPNSRIAWRSEPDSDIEHTGSVVFTRALGDRGTNVRVRLDYHPPGGTLGQWVAKLFGEEPKQQIHDDLRRFKRLMEIGEIITTEGQPRGTCTGGLLNFRG